MKKSLKELATSVGSEVTVSPIDMDIGVEDLLDFEEMMSLTPTIHFSCFESVN